LVLALASFRLSYIQSVPEVVTDALDRLAKTRAAQRMGNA
jgi:hypothetical protein